MTERSWVQIPTEETIFQAPFIWIKSLEQWKLTWHCCICCNPAKGRVDFEDGWLIKPSFITKDEKKLVSWPGPNSHKKPLFIIICVVNLFIRTVSESRDKLRKKFPNNCTHSHTHTHTHTPTLTHTYSTYMTSSKSH